MKERKKERKKDMHRLKLTKPEGPPYSTIIKNGSYCNDPLTHRDVSNIANLIYSITQTSVLLYMDQLISLPSSMMGN
jgi:hypothetical protein